MKKIGLSLCCLLLSVLCFAGQAATFKELHRPGMIAIDNGRMFIADGFHVHIYSLKDFKRIKTFGKKGEGPGEFKVRLRKDGGGVTLEVRPDFILVNSIKRLSVFSRDGLFIKQLTVPGSGFKFRAFGKNFAGYGTAMENFNFYRTINIYDHQLNMVKEVFRRLEDGNHDKNIRPITGNLQTVRTYGKKIYINNEDVIHIYNHGGDRVQTIKPEKGYKRLEYTGTAKEEVRNFYKKDPQGWAFLKSRITFPRYFPRIRSFTIAGEKIYIETFEKKNNKTRFVLFGLKGTFLGKPFVPFQYVNVEKAYPYTIHQDKLYQLIENPEDETWELFVHGLKPGRTK